MTLGAINYVQNNTANALLPPDFTPQAKDESFSWRTTAFLTAGIAVLLFATIGAIISFSLLLPILVSLAIFTPIAIGVIFFPFAGMYLIKAAHSHEYDLSIRRPQLNDKHIELMKINS